jgi:hypothetical protein
MHELSKAAFLNRRGCDPIAGRGRFSTGSEKFLEIIKMDVNQYQLKRTKTILNLLFWMKSYNFKAILLMEIGIKSVFSLFLKWES